MTESERMQIKGALRECAKENEGKTTYTGHVVISSVCNAAADRIEELEKENTELKDYAIQLKQAAVKRDEELTKQLLEFDKERTKAKEIIKELLDLDILPEIEIKKTAENFIKENSLCQISIE